MRGQNGQKCHDCNGEGAIFRDFGPEACTSCFGLGELPPASVLCERRLRELESAYTKPGETGQDVRWLIGEVRRAHHALLQILAASQDLSSDDDLAKRIRFLANDVLGVYPASASA
jgi:hypothetical protein